MKNVCEFNYIDTVDVAGELAKYVAYLFGWVLSICIMSGTSWDICAYIKGIALKIVKDGKEYCFAVQNVLEINYINYELNLINKYLEYTCYFQRIITKHLK